MKNLKEELIQMTKDWDCEDNALIQSLIEQYVQTYNLCNSMLKQLNNEQLMSVREDRYKGNMLVSSPLLKDCPKLMSELNKLAQTIVNTIEKVGTKPEKAAKKSALESFLETEDGDEEG